MDLLAYLEAITDLDPLLPVLERDEFERYQRSAEFVSDSRWPGWGKYLGPRPQQRPMTLLPMARRLA
jgi:hypothetical protein